MKYYVDCNAADNGSGSKEKPFKLINDAAEIAEAGDEVIVCPGVYREYVNPKHSGKEYSPIVYRSLKEGKAIITGAEVLSCWTRYEGNTWTTSVDNMIFGSYNPYTTMVCGDWYFAPTVRHTGSVYLNDLPMYETVTLEECLRGEVDQTSWRPEESRFKWYSEQKCGRTVFYANFQDKNPNKETVEIAVRRNVFMPDKNEVNYITVSGFVMKDAATTWAPPAAYQDGLMGPHWSKCWVIENCEIYNSRCCGISLGKYLDPENNMYFYTKQVKSPTQMERESVCRGQYHGWLKERIGSHLIRNCEIHHCEQTGIVGRMGGVFSTIEDCHIHHICNSQQLGGAETAGIKLHAAIDVTIRRNHIHDCLMGIWCDWEAQGTRITQNFLHDNQRPDGVCKAEGSMFSTDLFIEVSHGPTLVDNNILISKTSICMPTEGLGIIHNLIAGSFVYINAGVDYIVNGRREPRYTPYHIQHRTEVAGFMTILHGDDRIYNNIFIQNHPVSDEDKTAQNEDYERVGTAAFDIFETYDEWIKRFDFSKEPDMLKLEPSHYSHLPVWIDGNAYLNGADVFEKEKNKFVDNQNPVYLKLEKENGSYSLSTNAVSLASTLTDKTISTESLGKAFEPEQRFENPDGTDIVFDVDFFGEHRGTTTIPGPFAKDTGGVYVIYRN